MSMSTIRLLNQTGDISVTFDVTTGEGVDEARALFDRARGGGMTTFRVDGRETSRIDAFDTEAQEIVCFAPVIGG